MDKPEVWFAAIAVIIVYLIWRDQGAGCGCEEQRPAVETAPTCSAQAAYV